MKKLYKSAMLTDIHWGKKANSEQHNQDCLDYIDWFCSRVENDPEIDNIVFLGDWHENRSAINISTLDYSYRGAKKLNALGLPVFFIIGNHDLYHRHTRAVHSVIPFQEFEHFQVIHEPVHLTQLGEGTILSPYLFHHEYPDLKKWLKVPVWMGHFEFKDFIVTGYNITLLTGPDIADFKGPNRIFSGHFHKRQTKDHVTYIGNTFPMDFSDVGDFERGMAVYDHQTNNLEFINWLDCPKYIRTTLSKALEEKIELPSKSRIKCIADVELSYEESTVVKSMFMEKFNLREFVLEEGDEVSSAISDTQTSVVLDSSSTEPTNVNDLMIQMLKDISVDSIDNNKLIEIYRTIK